MSRKQFPILGSRGATIDFQLVADHGKQAYANHYQSVERLAARGGLSWAELHAVLYNRNWQKMDENTAIVECRKLEATYVTDTEPFCAKQRGEPHNRTDWFAGDVDCDGNELITVRKNEWNTICEQREKFMWQVRDTCTRAENAEARIEALQAEVETLKELLRRAVGSTPAFGLPWVKEARQALKGTDNAE